MSYYLPGPAGVVSPGVAPDGLRGQYLRKASDLDFDTEWADIVIPAGGGTGSVTSVGLSAPTGFSVAGSPVTGSGTIALSFAAGYSLPTTAKQTDWDTAFSERLRWDGSATGLVAATGRSSLGLGSAATSATTDFAAASHTQAASTISDSTAAGRALLTAADAAAQRTSLGLGTFATANAATPPAIGLTTPAAGSFTNVFQPSQASAPSTPASGFTLYANASNALSWIGANGFTRTFDATGITANRSWSLPDRPGTVALAGEVLPLTFTSATITYAASVALDLSTLNGSFQTISLTGNLTLTTSNLAVGRQVTLRLICDATQRTLTVPAGWVFVGTKPSNIAASKTAILSLTFFGSTDADCIAAYGVQS